ncbi:jg627, partial [Pararge aegeria aegeria]
TITSAAIDAASPTAASPTDALDLGARLLGDVHRVPYALSSAARHASFFLMSEDSWDCLDVQVMLQVL